MGWKIVTAWVFDCDMCGEETPPQADDKLPQGWHRHQQAETILCSICNEEFKHNIIYSE